MENTFRDGWPGNISSSRKRLACDFGRLQNLLNACHRFASLHFNSFSVRLSHFIFFSFLGFEVLKGLKPRISSNPGNLDLFFTSVSATTASSMSVVEMEVFSNAQLLILTILMFLGGEVCVSTIGVLFKGSNIVRKGSGIRSVGPIVNGNGFNNILQSNSSAQVELTSVDNPESLGNGMHHQPLDNSAAIGIVQLRKKSIKYLGLVLTSYLFVVHLLGVILVSLYITLIPSAKQVLQTKGLNPITFSVFTIVSTFSSCGYVPTNENMIVFSKNKGLLLILIPQILAGNTLFPPCLRLTVWFLDKFVKKEETKYILKNYQDLGYRDLFSAVYSSFLAVTVLGFISIQIVMFCVMEWSSDALAGLNASEKLINSLFMVVNSRHTGESTVNVGMLSPAILVLFIVMMYLPPYTSFLPTNYNDVLKPENRNKRRIARTADNMIFSQLSYLVIFYVIFIILVCITERSKLKDDPLNFNVLNIAVEVISAYGNVGFSTGYSCELQLVKDASCKDKWFGFSGKWSDEGKIVLIIVMFFGRLKSFNMNGGKAWKLM